MTGTPEATVEKWICVVAALLSPANPGLAIEPLRLMRRHMQGYAPGAFTQATAAAVVEAKRFGPVPSWDVIAGVLREASSDWHRQRKDPADVRLLAGRVDASDIPDRKPRTDEELAYARERLEECKRILRGSSEPPPEDRPRPRSCFVTGPALQELRRRAGVSV
jgi:hypothetical protein